MDRRRAHRLAHAQGHLSATQHLHVHEGHRRVAARPRVPRHAVRDRAAEHCRLLVARTVRRMGKKKHLFISSFVCSCSF